MSAVVSEQDVLDAMGGSNAAFTKIIQATRNTVSSVALAIVKDLDASEEVTQQVYIQCWEKLSTLKNPTSFLPWVRQSTRYAAFNYLRDNKINQRVGGDEADQLFAEFCAAETSLEDHLTRTQQTQILARLLDNLPDETREIVLLYYREEQSSRQVAQLLDISNDAVRQQLARARQTLRGKLLDKFGALVLATAPTLSMTAILAAGATASTPAQAATGSSLAQGGILGALKWLLSGAMLAATVGAIAVFLSAEIPLRKMPTEKLKAQLKKIRNQTVVATLVAGLILAAAYELTNGWWAPIIAYELFMCVLFVQTTKMQKLIAFGQQVKGPPSKSARWGQCAGRVGLYAAILIGNAAMLVGLYNSGRSFF